MSPLRKIRQIKKVDFLKPPAIGAFRKKHYPNLSNLAVGIRPVFYKF